jgi:hypothetical protein
VGTTAGLHDLAKFLTTNFVVPPILPHRRRMALESMGASSYPHPLAASGDGRFATMMVLPSWGGRGDRCVVPSFAGYGRLYSITYCISLSLVYVVLDGDGFETGSPPQLPHFQPSGCRIPSPSRIPPHRFSA